MVISGSGTLAGFPTTQIKKLVLPHLNIYTTYILLAKLVLNENVK